MVYNLVYIAMVSFITKIPKRGQMLRESWAHIKLIAVGNIDLKSMKTYGDEYGDVSSL